MVDTLVGLVDKSIVLRAPDVGGTARYRLLAIVREHGAEHLADPAVRASRHRGYYLGVARAFAASFIGQGQPGLVAALEADAANLRLAFDGALAAADAAAATELATACWPWLMCAGRYGQASSWLDRARALPGDQEDDDQRARASASPVPFPVTGVAAGERAVESAARLASWSLAALGDIAGADALGATLAAAPAGTDPGDHGGASRVAALMAELAAAFAALRRGAFAECVSRCADLEAGLPAGERWVRGWAAWVTGVAGWCAGDRGAAGARLRAGLELFAPLRDELALALHLEAFAWLAAGRRDYQRAARLQGSADRIWRRLAAREGARAPRLGLMLLHAERDWAERDARDALGAAGYAAEHAAGAALSTEAAVASALPVSAGATLAVRAVGRPPAARGRGGGRPGRRRVPGALGAADGAGARGRRACRHGLDQPGHRGPAGGVQADGGRAPGAHPGQARLQLPGAGGRAGVPRAGRRERRPAVAAAAAALAHRRWLPATTVSSGPGASPTASITGVPMP